MWIKDTRKFLPLHEDVATIENEDHGYIDVKRGVMDNSIYVCTDKGRYVATTESIVNNWLAYMGVGEDENTDRAD